MVKKMKQEVKVVNKWEKLAPEKVIERTIEALKANGVEAFAVKNREEAKKKVLELIPKGAEVMTMSSVTLDTIDISKEINESGKYNSVRNKLMSMNREKQGREIQKLGAAPEYAVGSVHAVTQDGKVLIASASGSQLPAYVYGASKVIWVVSTKKIVKDMQEGIKRIYEYTFPLEDERARNAYGVGSGVNKLLIINKEFIPGRIMLIFVKEKLGF